MMTLRDISKRYANVVALDAVSLELAPGRTTALIGPSGCGKSTALRCLVGLVVPDSGEVAFVGQSLTPRDFPRIRPRIGYVIQEGGLFPHLTARRNCTLMPAHLGWERRKAEARADELAEMTHLPGGALDRFPHELSGGQRQRVALVRALMLDPDVLLLDEPLGALDPVVRGELQRELKDIFASLSKAVVIVTHDLAEAAYLSHDICVMRDGTIEQRASIGALRADPKSDFVRTFVGAQLDRVAALAEGAS